MSALFNTKMLSIDECKKILNKNEKQFTNEQLKAIRAFVLVMAEEYVSNLNKNSSHHE